MRWTNASIAALVVLALPLAAAAEGRGQGKDRGPKGGAGAGNATEQAIETAADAAFTELERQLIREFFDVGHADGGKGLPPGLQKQLDERGSLPPGLTGRPLPPGLAGKLGAPPHGYERIIVDDDVLLIHAATRAVVDAVIGAAKGG